MMLVYPPWHGEHEYWTLFLRMAVRDNATSVHYHPWRDDAPLSYIVGGQRYMMLSPPLENRARRRRLALVAGAMLARTRLGVWSRRWLGWPLRAAGCLRVEVDGKAVEWVGVVWATRGLMGVEWNRVANDVAITVPLD